ncbi:MAG: PIG-L family deacetylase [Candidatus Kapabacteria bacterium]|nr:PIG-L family deacetylase [Candidatus Kapabacteria bacterium]
MNRVFSAFLSIVLLLFANTALRAQPTEVMNTAKLQNALKKLSTLGSVLYVAAHPDDENTAFIAYCANERLFRTTYLSMTRGDGGQNIIGSEQSELLGIIRTQELLAARRTDGGEQLFTRALDFGYSKTPEETFKIWGKDRILADVVWAIRKMRPDVIVTRFPTTGEGGHGHHTASAILAGEAFAAAGDPNRFPEHLKFVKVWQPKRLLWNAWLPIIEARKANPAQYPSLDLSAYNPLLGKSATEIAAESRSMHKSQGFGVSALRGEALNYFEHLAGDSAKGDIFSGVDMTWNRIKGGADIAKALDEARKTFQAENPSVMLPALLKAYKAMNDVQKTTGEDFWIPQKRKELLELIRSAAGMWIEAIAQNQPQQGETGFSGVPGGTVRIAASIVNRSPAAITLKRVLFPFAGDSVIAKPLQTGKFQTITVTKTIPVNTPLSQPYWLQATPEKGLFTVQDQQLIGQPENKPSLEVSFVVGIGSEEITFTVPVLHRRTDRVLGEVYRPFIVVPQVSVNLPQRSFVFADTASKEISVLVQANTPKATGSVRLRLPEGWKSAPEQVSFTLTNKGDEMRAFFRVKPPQVSVNPDETVVAEAIVGTTTTITVNKGMTTIAYTHIPTQTILPEAKARLTRLELRKSIKTVGYIDGASDDVAEYLKQSGFEVALLSDEEIETGNLARYDAIVSGIRVYNDNARPRLRQQYRRLMDYVANGGTMLVQYQLSGGLVTDSIGPYPFTISRDRVTEEDAAVKMLKANHPLFSTPNVITQADFEGWVQERGLYFANKWDERYETLLSCNDAGETEKKGGMLLARYGKGAFIYTGYAWFRQLPAGVPGAYRLFTNLLHAAQTLNQGASPSQNAPKPESNK